MTKTALRLHKRILSSSSHLFSSAPSLSSLLCSPLRSHWRRPFSPVFSSPLFLSPRGINASPHTHILDLEFIFAACLCSPNSPTDKQRKEAEMLFCSGLLIVALINSVSPPLSSCPPPSVWHRALTRSLGGRGPLPAGASLMEGLPGLRLPRCQLVRTITLRGLLLLSSPFISLLYSPLLLQVITSSGLWLSLCVTAWENVRPRLPVSITTVLTAR